MLEEAQKMTESAVEKHDRLPRCASKLMAPAELNKNGQIGVQMLQAADHYGLQGHGEFQCCRVPKVLQYCKLQPVIDATGTPAKENRDQTT